MEAVGVLGLLAHMVEDNLCELRFVGVAVLGPFIDGTELAMDEILLEKDIVRICALEVHEDSVPHEET
jgi:hypothetical protein